MSARPVLMVAAVATISALSSTGNAAIDIDGDALYSICTDDYRPVDTSTCLGYVIGVEDVMAGGDAVAGHKACLDEHMSEQRLISIVKDYLRDAGNQGVNRASALVAIALEQAFPCPR